MIRIINNTDIHKDRLLVLYAKELATVVDQPIECIVFDSCQMTVWGIDRVILEVKE